MWLSEIAQTGLQHPEGPLQFLRKSAGDFWFNSSKLGQSGEWLLDLGW